MSSSHHDSNLSAGAAWAQSWSSPAAAAAGQPGGASGGVAVPKNQQKNLISRERNSISRKAPGWRERLLPRNMQDRDTDADRTQDGFINIQLELPEDRQEVSTDHGQQDSVVSVVSGQHSHSLSDMAETEDLAEADQSHDVAHIFSQRELWTRGEEDREQFVSPNQDNDRDSYLPEGVFPVRDSDSPAANNILAAADSSQPGAQGPHHGLDRVPIRLQSSGNNVSNGGWAGLNQAAAERIEARRLEEADAVASIIDDVLASSPELANTDEANRPPSP